MVRRSNSALATQSNAQVPQFLSPFMSTKLEFAKDQLDRIVARIDDLLERLAQLARYPEPEPEPSSSSA